MQSYEPEKESHQIEAIVFTADFLPCYKEHSRRRPNWIFGSSNSTDSTETSETSDDNSSSYSEEDGLFGLKRTQLICYENSEDLTRKIDALFHQKHNKPMASAPPLESRDDVVEQDERRCCSDPPSRRGHRRSSTWPLVNRARTQEELNHWYSSSWSSYKYYGNAEECHGMPAFKHSETIRCSPKRAPRSTTRKPKRLDSSWRHRVRFAPIPENIEIRVEPTILDPWILRMRR